MGAFSIYIFKSAVCLALFYLFYKLLLSRETFHGFNRMALLGILAFSSFLPLAKVTVQQPTAFQQTVMDMEHLFSASAQLQMQETELTVQTDSGIWLGVLLVVYVVGVVFFIVRNLYSIFRLWMLMRQCRHEPLESYLSDCSSKAVLLVHDRQVSPFSWLHYIIVSRADLQENGREILIHELAHIRKRHSWDLLLADCCIFVQWFNPAAWLLKQELQTIHEYEADETVIQEGVNARQYQILIIKKAVGTRLYSMANSLNHSSLKKRITMMMKEKSNPWARLKYLYVLPVAAMTLTAFARPEVSSVMNEISSDKVNDLVALMKEKIVEKADTVAPVSVSAEVAAKLKGTVLVVAEEMPQFPDGGMAGLMKYLAANIRYPESAKKAGKQGRVIVQLVVRKDGSISDVRAFRGIDPALDAEAVRVLSAMPKWVPGRQNGEAVDVKYTVPVMFRLPDRKEKSVEKADTVAPVSVPAEVSAKLKGTVFGVVEEMPEFPDGGTAGLMKYLAANIRYPESAKKAGKQGRVTVQFVVCKDGSITNVSTLRGIDPALDAEAIRVISAMPKWKPGRQRGKEVDVKYMVPVMFRLPDGSQSSSSKAADDGNKPLVLVDGRECTEELSKLPSSSIASVDVLLGDQGVAQYGEKARHGVMKVTLKKAGSQSVAQEAVQVKGRVTDQSGQPVIGAIVQISGSKNGTVTDVDGSFQLTAPRDAVLEVAYIGLARAQVKVQPELTVILKEDKKK